MRDFAVHKESGTVGGPRRVVRLFRRVLVRILLPVFRRLATLLENMDADQRRLKEQQASMARQLDALLNRGWDQSALIRRLAILEEQVEMLRQHLANEAAEAESHAQAG